MTPDAADRQIRRLTAQLAAMEQLLAVHEQTVREQSTRLEDALATLNARAQELERLNAQLASEKQNLQRANAIMLKREERILQMKQEVNDLTTALGQPPRYRP
jgi:chromosome segregation ATPase